MVRNEKMMYWYKFHNETAALRRARGFGQQKYDNAKKRNNSAKKTYDKSQQLKRKDKTENKEKSVVKSDRAINEHEAIHDSVHGVFPNGVIV